ncbi:secreted beta-glucosidase SUN4 like protein [Verticillium longisporum]|nr:secreted beta-glucosidase SUN4 like protein [Verticillium longisporum]
MVIPTIPQPGEKVALTNPSANDYYVWNNLPTTAQYYVNKKGLPVEDACTWNSPVDPKGAGNWAPINIGTGKAADGNTYISIFPNLPTSTAQLDFNIEIIGDVNTKCALIDGQYTGGGSTGCTSESLINTDQPYGRCRLQS